MNLSSVDDTIKRPATAITQQKVNLNTRLRPLNSTSNYNKISTDNGSVYNNRIPFTNTLPNQKISTRYNSRRVTNISSDEPGLYPISPLEKLNLPHMFIENSSSSDPVHLNIENFSQVTRHAPGNVPKKSVANFAKYSSSGIQKKLTTKSNTGILKKTKLKEFLNKKSKITLKCFCILLLLLIPIIIFIVMIIYSSSLELDKPKEMSKKSPI